MNQDRTRAALAALDPEDRALLELSGVRGLADHEIAGMLGLEPARMRERRQAAAQRLAASLGTSQRMAEKALTDLRSPAAGEDPAGEVASEEPAGEHPGTGPVREEHGDHTGEDQPSGDKRGLVAGLGGLAIAAGVAVALALGGGDGGSSSTEESATDPSATADSPGPQRVGRAVPLRSVTRDRDRGSASARLVETSSGARRVRLAVRELPSPGEARYVAWLYESVSDARRIASFPKGTFSATLPLPRGYERYRFLDLSLEPSDGNRSHSGESVLRVPLQSLPAP